MEVIFKISLGIVFVLIIFFSFLYTSTENTSEKVSIILPCSDTGKAFLYSNNKLLVETNECNK